MSAPDLSQFKRDRRRALLSLDQMTIQAYLAKYGEQEWPSDPRVFWAAVHKARLALADIPEREKSVSRAWLKKHGFKTSIAAD